MLDEYLLFFANFMNRRNGSLFALLLCLLSVSGNCVFASDQTWQILLNDGTLALEANDTRYAMYKLQNAWLAVFDQSLDSDPHRKIADAIAETIAKARNRQAHESSMEDLDRQIRLRVANRFSGQFDCELRRDGTLAFFAHLDLYAPTAGYCATDSFQRTEKERVAIDRENNDQAQCHKELMVKMPITFMPGSKKYDELLSLCQPIKTGQRKEIGFDLNPFLPQEFETTQLF